MARRFLPRRPRHRPAKGDPQALPLLACVFIVSTCGLVFELIAGTVASYLLGDSITQFSLVIGVYLFAMGGGSYLARFVRHDVARTFVRVEILLGLVGGFSSALLFVAFDQVQSFRILLFTVVATIGGLVGLEIPLLIRLLKRRQTSADRSLRRLISNVFTFDYIGALLASVLFPLVLVPHLGLIRSAILFGAFNIGVAAMALRLLRPELPRPQGLRLAAMAALGLLAMGYVGAGRIMSVAEASAFPDPVIHAKQSAYQRLVLTRGRHDLRLYLNGNLQFSSRDEYRYHEALVHPGLQAVRDRIAGPLRILVLGGGDGLAVREILKYPDIESVTLVDLDPMMTTMFQSVDDLKALTGGSLLDPRVRIHNADAFIWLRANRQRFHFVVLDFPDPSTYALGKLYSTAFFAQLEHAIAPGGAAVVQSTSPLIARQSYWCVTTTLEAIGLRTTPYHAYVPSFGEWGFVMASHHPFVPAQRYLPGLRFINPRTLAELLHFPPDMERLATEVNRLNNQALVRYFDAEWGTYLR